MNASTLLAFRGVLVQIVFIVCLTLALWRYEQLANSIITIFGSIAGILFVRARNSAADGSDGGGGLSMRPPSMMPPPRMPDHRTRNMLAAMLGGLVIALVFVFVR